VLKVNMSGIVTGLKMFLWNLRTKALFESIIFSVTGVSRRIGVLVDALVVGYCRVVFGVEQVERCPRQEEESG